MEKTEDKCIYIVSGSLQTVRNMFEYMKIGLIIPKKSPKNHQIIKLL